MKIAVLSDSGCGLSSAEAREKGLFLLPLQIMNETTAYRDCFDITTLQLYDMVEKGALPKTSSPLVKDVEDTMNEIIEKGYTHILCVSLSSGLSGTHQVISLIAKQKKIPLTMVEIYSTCVIQRYLALEAVALVAKGTPLETIVKQLNSSIEESETLILPNDLNHLKRGGRLTPMAATLANLLKIKPILQISKKTAGKIDVFDKVRTESKATASAIDYLCNQMNHNKYEVFVIHSACEDKAKMIAKAIGEKNQNAIISVDIISSVVACHTGLDCIAIQIIKSL